MVVRRASFMCMRSIRSTCNYSVEYWKLQMADLAVQKRKKKTMTQGRKLLAKSTSGKPLEFSEDLAGTFKFVAHKL